MKFKGVGDIRYISSTLWNPRPDSKTKKGGSWEEIDPYTVLRKQHLLFFRQHPAELPPQGCAPSGTSSLISLSSLHQLPIATSREPTTT